MQKFKPNIHEFILICNNYSVSYMIGIISVYAYAQF